MSRSSNRREHERPAAHIAGSAPPAAILPGAYLHKMGEDASDEQRVAEFWRGYGVEVEPLEDTRERFSRRPDFLLRLNGRPWSYCEVKTIWRHRWGVRILHEGRPAEEKTEETTKPVSVRVSDDLILALRQLRAENPDHTLLNIVVLVNRDGEASPELLAESFRGQPATTGRSLKARIEARMAREIRQFQTEVDLCLWCTPAESGVKVEKCFLLNPRFQGVLRVFAGLGPEKFVCLDPAA